MSTKRELGRGERVLPGLWRLRLPLPWPGVPHGNAWAIAAGSGVVLVDTGYHEPGSLDQLERAMGQVNLRLEHVRLIAVTHAHSDHWGQAAPIIERAGCELWMHRDHRHATETAGDPNAALARRLEIAPIVHGEPLSERNASWLLSETLCYLTHLEALGRVEREPNGGAAQWRLVAMASVPGQP